MINMLFVMMTVVAEWSTVVIMMLLHQQSYAIEKGAYNRMDGAWKP